MAAIRPSSAKTNSKFSDCNQFNPLGTEGNKRRTRRAFSQGSGYVGRTAALPSIGRCSPAALTNFAAVSQVKQVKMTSAVGPPIGRWHRPFFGASSYRPRDPLKVRALKRPRPPGADGRRRLADRTLCSANIVSVKVNLVEFSMLDSIFRINEYANELICIRFAYSNERNILEKLLNF